MLRSRDVAGANVVQMLMVAGMLGMFFLAVLYLQRVLGYDAIETGAAFLPGLARDRHALARVLGAAEHAASAPRAVLLPALALIAAGLALPGPGAGRRRLRRRPPAGDARCSAIGGGLAFPALMTLAMSGVAPEDSGLASGLVNTTQQVGGALGLAVLATVAADAHRRREPAEALLSRLQRRVRGRRGARGRRASWSPRSCCARGAGA